MYICETSNLFTKSCNISMLITLVVAPDMYTCSCTDLLKKSKRSKIHLPCEFQNENYITVNFLMMQFVGDVQEHKKRISQMN